MVRKAVQKVDCVIHLAAVISVSTFPNVKAMQDVNVKGGHTIFCFQTQESFLCCHLGTET